ncbi:cobyrinate a,c-diamide synthase [Aquamicrobium segne]|uniref:Hydrogenobyrinate a,c-diamide synthase n=1 Tax=Aquamicrobium segne TaxID=469547 RepID=A0ABW0GT75_9HYPH
MTARGFIVGADRSGAGKTCVTIGLMRAFARAGLAVRGAKSGPDYIDPSFHRAATGHPGVNLDSWAMEPTLIDRLAGQQAAGADLLVVESAMGLFDGIPGAQGRTGAAADLARRLGLPVLLVHDVSGHSRTAAAIVHGMAAYDPGVKIGGVVLNKVGSERHEILVRDAIEKAGIPVLGTLRRNLEMVLPERHLGLVQAGEHAALDAFIERLADRVEKTLDLAAIKAMAAPLHLATGSTAHALPPPGQRIALALDEAFSFVYPHMLDHWRDEGAEIVPFSPLAGEGPDPSCDAGWLPGGYPELHAGRLAAASTFRDRLTAFSRTRPVHGECGGFMVLGKELVDGEGITHRMTGLLGHTTSFTARHITLGYRQARLMADCPLGRAGATINGHEFHYSSLIESGGDAPLADLSDGEGRSLGPAGARRGNVTGAFFHAIAQG